MDLLRGLSLGFPHTGPTLFFIWIFCSRQVAVHSADSPQKPNQRENATSRTSPIPATDKPKQNLLDIILANYDLDKWPTFSDDDEKTAKTHPTNSTLWVDIMFISSINVEAMDLTIDMYLNQAWHDRRLKFTDEVSRRKIHLKTPEQMRRIWSPDTYIVNAKQANFHHITTENRVVYIGQEGDVFYSARITAKVACEMKFHSFPMDTQQCELHLASYAYTTDILMMLWRTNDADTDPEIRGDPVTYTRKMDLNQFHLTNFSAVQCVDTFAKGPILFKFERRVAHHLIQTFLPTVLIVTISWVSFYIQAEAVPARISLGITTLLTMITLNSGTKQGLPPVSYVKAIDVWMGVCTFFVFSAIWEYVVVCILIRRPLGCQRHANASQPPGRRTSSPPGSRFIRNSLSSLVIPNTHACESEPPVYCTANRAKHDHTTTTAYGLQQQQSRTRQTSFHSFHDQPEEQGNHSDGHAKQLQTQQHLMRAHRAASTPNSHLLTHRSDQVLKVVWEPRSSKPETGIPEEQEFHLQTSPSVEQVVSRRKKKLKIQCICMSQARNAQERSKRVDIIARVGYPVLFLIFNLIYWPFYLLGMGEVRD